MNNEYTKCGNFYFCVNLTNKNVLYVHADETEILGNGALIFYRKSINGDLDANIAFQASEWKTFYIADLMTGDSVCVEHDSSGYLL